MILYPVVKMNEDNSFPHTYLGHMKELGQFKPDITSYKDRTRQLKEVYLPS